MTSVKAFKKLITNLIFLRFNEVFFAKKFYFFSLLDMTMESSQNYFVDSFIIHISFLVSFSLSNWRPRFVWLWNEIENSLFCRKARQICPKIRYMHVIWWLSLNIQNWHTISYKSLEFNSFRVKSVVLFTKNSCCYLSRLEHVDVTIWALVSTPRNFQQSTPRFRYRFQYIVIRLNSKIHEY